MNISKNQLDRYIETKRDLVALEQEHAENEKRLLTARMLVSAFEACGISYDADKGVLRFVAEQTDEQRGRRVGATVNADDLF